MNLENAQNEQNTTLRAFLQDELAEVNQSLDQVQDKIEEQQAGGIKAWFRRSRGRIDEDDYKSLRNELEEKNKRLKELPDDDVRLFLLRKEIGNLKEEVATLGAKRSWRLPIRAWVALVILPFVIYFISLAVLQGRSQEQINSYATQTAAAMPTPVPSPTMTPPPLPTTIQ